MKRVFMLVIVTIFAQALFSQVVRDQVPRVRVVVEEATDVTG